MAKRVLVVDDEKLIVKQLQKILVNIAIENERKI